MVGKLKFSIVSTGKYVIPYMLSNFMSQNKGVALMIDVTNKAEVIESLELNKVDFVIVSVLPKKLNIERVELMPNKLSLIAGKRGLNKARLTKKNIFEQSPLIYREMGSATRVAMEQFIIKNKFDVRKKIELTSNEAVKLAVIAGLGVSIMPIIGLKNELMNKSAQIIPVKGLPIITKWNLIWLKSKKLSPTAKAFLEYLKSEKEQEIKANFNWIEAY
ncbi:LysR substrate-binding domain-containing protein [Maribacter arcticus]|uniref:LysR substrate-binding domain-containing protein n=1 Tax=Maribacter arcticus TaxID=561365 RepID=UPI0030028114